jgi:hypothetical protein
MYIQDCRTQERIEVVVEYVSPKDLKLIKKNSAFNFDWDKYKNKELYKLRTVQDDKIQGLMCVVDHTDEFTNAIEIELLELSEENIGKKKKFDRIAGVLIAFACMESLKRGHEGYIFLTPKTTLIKHYEEKYHLLFTGPIGNNPVGVMVAEERIARKLIKLYLE